MDQKQPNEEQKRDYVLNRYEAAIRYYWKASRHNKKSYKLTRTLTIILGATVTLIASLSSADFIEGTSWDTLFAIAAPVLAAVLTIVGGFGQTFHWGAAWRDMVLNAQRIEKERDRFIMSDPKDRDINKEIAILNELVITETQSFFQRILGGARKDIPEKEEKEEKEE